MIDFVYPGSILDSGEKSMGAVVVRHEFVVMDRGYPCGNYKIYRYCDSCGSFHITARFQKKNLQIMLTIAALLGLLFILFNEMFWPGVIIFFSLGLFFPWMDYLFLSNGENVGIRTFVITICSISNHMIPVLWMYLKIRLPLFSILV